MIFPSVNISDELLSIEQGIITGKGIFIYSTRKIHLSLSTWMTDTRQITQRRTTSTTPLK